jgi:hypothetical protein
MGIALAGHTQEGAVSVVTVLKWHKANKILPPGYRVDDDPKVAVLRRGDNSVVAFFPIWSFEPTLALEEAEVDLAREGHVWER